MKTICWNARGLGNPRAFRALRDLVSSRRPQVLFISERKCGDEIINKIKQRCNFDGGLTVKSEGAKGGLCLLWKDQHTVTINSLSQNHIDSTVNWCGKTWQFTGIYGHPETNKK